MEATLSLQSPSLCSDARLPEVGKDECTPLPQCNKTSKRARDEALSVHHASKRERLLKTSNGFEVDSHAVNNEVARLFSNNYRHALDEVLASVQSRECGNYGAVVQCPGEVHIDMVRLVAFTGARFLPRSDLSLAQPSTVPHLLLPQNAQQEDVQMYQSEAARAFFLIIAERAPPTLSLEALCGLLHATQYFWAEPRTSSWSEPVAKLLPLYFSTLKAQLNPLQGAAILQSAMKALIGAFQIDVFLGIVQAVGACFTRSDVAADEFEPAARQLIHTTCALCAPSDRETSTSSRLFLQRVLTAVGERDSADVSPPLALISLLLAAASCSICTAGTPVPASSGSDASSCGAASGDTSASAPPPSARGQACIDVALPLRGVVAVCCHVLTDADHHVRAKGRAAVQLLSSTRDVLRRGPCSCYAAAVEATAGLRCTVLPSVNVLLTASAIARTGTLTARHKTVLAGHTDGITSVAFSPDGLRLASASNDFTVRIWSMATLQCLSVLECNKNIVTSIAWCPDGKLLATASYTGHVGVWDTSTGLCSAVLEGHEFGVSAVAWSPCGKYIASSSYDSSTEILFWDSRSGARKVSLQSGHRGTVASLAWGPDGTSLASASHDGSVRIWGVTRETTEFCCTTVLRHSSPVRAVQWAADGRRLASASCGSSSTGEPSVIVWDTACWTQKSTMKSSLSYLDCIAWSPDCRHLASGAEEDVSVWDAGTGESRLMLQGHTDAVRCIAWSRHGRLASGSDDGTVQVT